MPSARPPAPLRPGDDRQRHDHALNSLPATRGRCCSPSRR
jgi:hypothetical protein